MPNKSSVCREAKAADRIFAPSKTNSYSCGKQRMYQKGKDHFERISYEAIAAIEILKSDGNSALHHVASVAEKIRLLLPSYRASNVCIIFLAALHSHRTNKSPDGQHCDDVNETIPTFVAVVRSNHSR